MTLNLINYHNFERTALIVGTPAAEELERNGLIRHDAWTVRKPSHYVLTVRAGAGPFQRGPWLRNEVEEVLRTAIGAPYVWHYGGSRGPVTSVELVYQRKGPAETQAKNARLCGLEAEVVACVLMPVDKIG